MAITLPSEKRREVTRNVALLCFSLFFYTLGTGQIAFLQPLYIHLRGASPLEVGAALAAQYACQLISLVPSGYLSDRFPRKTVIVASWAVATLGVLVMAAAGSLAGLILGMMIFGLSNFGNAATGHYMAEIDREQTPWIFALISASGRVGTVASPALGAALTQYAGVQASYLLSGILCAVSTLFVLGLTRQSVTGVRSLRDSLRLTATDPTLLALALPLLAVYLAGSLADSFAANFLRDVARLDVATVGRLGSVLAVGSALVSLTAGRITRRRERLAGAIAVCLGATAVGLSLMVGLSGLSLAAGLAVVLFGLAFFLRGAEISSRTLVSAHLAQSLRRENVGMGFAAAGMLMGLAQIVGPPVSGWLYARNPTWPFLVALVVLLGGGALLVRLVWRTGREAAAHAA